MASRTSSDDNVIRHQQERDRQEAEAQEQVERARFSMVGSRGLGAMFVPDVASDTEKAVERATQERSVKPDRGAKTE